MAAVRPYGRDEPLLLRRDEIGDMLMAEPWVMGMVAKVEQEEGARLRENDARMVAPERAGPEAEQEAPARVRPVTGQPPLEALYVDTRQNYVLPDFVRGQCHCKYCIARWRPIVTKVLNRLSLRAMHRYRLDIYIPTLYYFILTYLLRCCLHSLLLLTYSACREERLGI